MNIKECMNVEAEIDGKPWYHDIKAYIKNGEYLSGATDSEKRFIKCMVCQFFFSGKVLYNRNHDRTLLRCIDASRLIAWWKRCMKACLEPMPVDPCWLERL